MREEPLSALEEHARIPIVFKVDRLLVMSVENAGMGGFILSERKLDVPYIKDYDTIDGGPAAWTKRFDVSNWGLISAHSRGQRVGGAVIAVNTPGVDMLEGCADLAVLWDIRVKPDLRGHGIGSELFRAAEEWAAARNCRELKVETQNINVAACKFYERQGCVLGAIHRFAYRNCPDEIQMLWYKNLVLRK